MNWFDWTLVSWLAFGVFASIFMIGKPRKPLTADVAALTLVINALLVAGVVFAR